MSISNYLRLLNTFESLAVIPDDDFSLVSFKKGRLLNKKEFPESTETTILDLLNLDWEYVSRKEFLRLESENGHKFMIEKYKNKNVLMGADLYWELGNRS